VIVNGSPTPIVIGFFWGLAVCGRCLAAFVRPSAARWNCWRT
jgi:hypothetical protein